MPSYQEHLRSVSAHWSPFYAGLRFRLNGIIVILQRESHDKKLGINMGMLSSGLKVVLGSDVRATDQECIMGPCGSVPPPHHHHLQLKRVWVRYLALRGVC